MRKRSPIIGLTLAAIAAAAVLALPQAALDGAATAIGAGAIVPQAAPPLGMTARGLLAVVAFAAVLAIALLLGSRKRDEVEPEPEADLPERDFFADSTPYSLDPPVIDTPAPEPVVSAAPPVSPRPEPVVERPSPPAELGGLRDAIGQIAADVAALRAQQAHEADDSADTLRTAQLTEALRSVEALLREQKDGSAENPAWQLKRLEARLDSIAAKIDALSARPAPAAPADPETAQRVSAALAELRQVISRPAPSRAS